MSTFGVIISVLLLVAIYWTMFMAFRVLVPLAIFFDAKSLGIKNYAKWIVFGIFFPLITAIVYSSSKATASKIVPKMCIRCQTTVSNDTPICPNCGSSVFIDYIMPDREKKKKISKTLSIFAIVVYCVGIISITAVGPVASKAIMPYAHDPESFFDQFEKEFENEFGDGSDSNDSDEYDNFDDFYENQNPFDHFGE